VTRALDWEGCLNVRDLVDLRWPEERAEDPPRDIDVEVEVVPVSVPGAYDPAFDDGASDFLPQRGLEWFLRATPAEAMARTLEQLDRTYGGVEEYLRGGGLDEARLQRLKDRLVAP
jgi:hypothetical protein